MQNKTHCRFLLRTAFVCLLSFFTALSYANSTPSFCIGNDTIELNATSLQAITDITGFSQNGFISSDLNVTFATAPIQLFGLTPGTTLILPPSTQRPTGISGKVVTIDDSASPTLVVRVRPSRLPGDEEVTDVSSGLQVSTPLGDPRSSCNDSVPGEDTNGDGSIDFGIVEGNCTATTGGEFGFSYEIEEGVNVNGVITLSPLEMEASVIFEDQELIGFTFTNESTISFTGEISAETAATLENKVYKLGSIPVGSYTLSVGPALTATISIVADGVIGVCGSVAAGTHTGLTATASTEYGYSFELGGNGGVIAEPVDTEVNVSPPELTSDTAANITFYGGAVLRAQLNFDTQGVVPIGGAALEVTALGATSIGIDPNSDPWWEITGQPAVFVDVAPQILLADLSGYTFDIVNPGPQVFFDSSSEFPFAQAAAPSNAAERQGSNRESGTALRWSRGFMSTSDYDMSDVAVTSDGGVILVGQSTSRSTVIRTNYLGDRVWQRELANAKPESVVETPDGGFLLSGKRSGALWLLKLTANGNIQWAREFEASNGDYTSVFIAQVDANGVTLGGEFVDNIDPTLRPWAARIDNDANVIWANTYGLDDEEELIEYVIGTNDGGLLMVGRTSYTPAQLIIQGTNAYSIKVEADGTVGWSHVFAGPNYMHLYGAAQASDGSYVMVGRNNGTTLNDNPRGLVLRFPGDPVAPATMSLSYARAIGGSYSTSDLWYDLLHTVTSQGDGFIFSGTSGLADGTKAWLGRFIEKDGGMRMVWSTYYDGLLSEDIAKVIDTGDGLLLAGDSGSFSAGNGEDRALWVTRVPYEGFINWNSDALASTNYTAMITDTPPGDLPTPLDLTIDEDLTARELSTPIVQSFVDLPSFESIPEAFTQIELIKEPLDFGDTDLDEFDDSLDNCIFVANPGQEDEDEDGFGNICDADFNNDCVINFIDYVYQTASFLSDDSLADLNSDGIVNFVDFSLFSALFLQNPGPSALAQCD